MKLLIIDTKFVTIEFKHLNELNKSHLYSGLDTQMYFAPEVKNFKNKDKSDLFSI